MHQPQPQYPYVHQTMNAPPQIPSRTTPREESFSSQATVFILKDKTWREQSQGLVRFVFDLNTYALRLIISPGTADEMDRRLRPRIRSKGPRAYVVRAQPPNNGDDSILAVRFEREEDSQNFRKFVEKRDVDNNNQSGNHSNRQIANQHGSSNQQGAPSGNAPPYNQGAHGPTYQNNMYQNVNGGMMPGGYNPNKPNGPYNEYYRTGNDGYYYPSPSPHTQHTYSQDYRGTPSSQMVNPATTPHNVSTHQSLYSQNNPAAAAAAGYGNGTQNNGQLLHRPTGSHPNNQWSPGYGNNGNNNNQQSGPGAPNGNQNGNAPGVNMNNPNGVNANGQNQEGPDHGYNGNNNNNNNNNNTTTNNNNNTNNNTNNNNNNNNNNGNTTNDKSNNNHHGHRTQGGGNNHYRSSNSMSGKGTTQNPNSNDAQAQANVNVLKLTEANLEQHNRVYAESSVASKRKNVRDIILEQLNWQREHGMAH